MKISRLGIRLLTQMIAFVFLMNTAVAYGSCCVAEQSESGSGAELPCHSEQADVADTDEENLDTQNCCNMCLSAIAEPGPLANHSAWKAPNNAQALFAAIIKPLIPLFKPPIQRLS